MKKILFTTFSIANLFVLANNVFAVCTYNGEVVPCDQMPKWPFVFMILFFVFMMAGLAFWVWMIVDVSKYEKENIVAWILVVVLLQILGAIIYYFARRLPRLREQKNINVEKNNNEMLSEDIEQIQKDDTNIQSED